jgi:hypothetical protein
MMTAGSASGLADAIDPDKNASQKTVAGSKHVLTNIPDIVRIFGSGFCCVYKKTYS